MKTAEELIEAYESLSQVEKLKFDIKHTQLIEVSQLEKMKLRLEIVEKLNSVQKDGTHYFDNEWIKENILKDGN